VKPERYLLGVHPTDPRFHLLAMSPKSQDAEILLKVVRQLGTDACCFHLFSESQIRRMIFFKRIQSVEMHDNCERCVVKFPWNKGANPTVWNFQHPIDWTRAVRASNRAQMFRLNSLVDKAAA